MTPDLRAYRWIVVNSQRCSPVSPMKQPRRGQSPSSTASGCMRRSPPSAPSSIVQPRQAPKQRAEVGGHLAPDPRMVRGGHVDGIRRSGVPYHYAYDFGMPRLSCMFCFYAPKSALRLAGSHNRDS